MMPSIPSMQLPEERRAILATMPSLISDRLTPPRANLQLVLEQIRADISDLQRRES